MLSIKIEGLTELHRILGEMGKKQLPFAAAKAITKTAKAVEARIQSDMAGAFTSASPYVKRATFSTSANKATLSALIGLKDQKPSGGTAPAVLLKEHFTGGARGNKPFEKAIAALGAMPRGHRAVPGSGMKLDAYGNPSRKEIGEMLGVLRTRMQVYKGRGKRTALVGYFIIPVGSRSHLSPGIYKRVAAGAIKAMFVFVPRAAYRKVMDMGRSAHEVVAREYQPNFTAAFNEAMSTAK